MLPCPARCGGIFREFPLDFSEGILYNGGGTGGFFGISVLFGKKTDVFRCGGGDRIYFLAEIYKKGCEIHRKESYMKFFYRIRSRKAGKRHPRRRWELRPCAFWVMLAGHMLIVVALGEFAARLHGGEAEAVVYFGEFMRSAAVAFAVVWGVGLGLDYGERRWGVHTS
jgi:hypothetical protein